MNTGQLYSKIKFTAVSIDWTEGGIMHVYIKASAGSEIIINWGNGRTTQHYFHEESLEEFSNNYFPKHKKPLDGVRFYVEISSSTPDCRIIGLYINCEMNPTGLDVSNCPELEELSYWGYHTEESTLDLSRNTALKHLNCSSNGFTSLNLANNTALEILNCRDNRLSHLSLKSNLALIELDCEFNNMEQLFIGYAPQLCAAKFEDGNNINEATKMQIQYLVAENTQYQLDE